MTMILAKEVEDGTVIRWTDESGIARVGTFQPCPGGTPSHYAHEGSRYFVASDGSGYWRWVHPKRPVETVEPETPKAESQTYGGEG